MSDEHPPAEAKTPIEQAVEHAFDLFVYAPIGILFEGSNLLPDLISKGKSQVAMARMLGQMVVGQAQKSAAGATSKLQDQTAGVLGFLGDSVAPVVPVAEPEVPEPAPPAPRPKPATAAKPATKAVDGAAQAVQAATLAIPDYDGLSASQVVNRLAGLSAAELTNVQRYEAAHRGRKTILSKVAQLQGT